MKIKFSEWIRLAVADVKKVVRSPKYEFDLDVWHKPNSVCRICLGGARMMGLGVDSKELAEPEDFKEEDQLIALDNLRSGDIWEALTSYYGRVYEKLQRLVDEYENQWDYKGVLTRSERKKFYKDMLGFADELEKLDC